MPSKAELYVLARRNADAMWSNLTAEERKEAEDGIRWAKVFGQVYTGPKMKGRPPGAKNHTAQIPISEGLNMDNQAIAGAEGAA
jgi:hypothetical protein